MNILSTPSTSTYSEKELLSLLLQQAHDGEIPLALWREPATGVKHLIISENCRSLSTDVPLEELDAGFLMAPFEKQKHRWYLPADLFFTFENGRLKTDPGTPAPWLNAKLRNPGTPPRQSLATGDSSSDTGRQSFMGIIEACVSEIERGTFEKIVPSRTKHIALPEDFNIIQSFQKLCDNYPDALISFVSIPAVGSWLGASPEVLVSVRDKAVFKTVALAGTLPFQPGTNLKAVAWTQKEIEEQALVERYIISCFKKIRLREYEEHGPKTVVAGNLIHLRSDFTVDMKATNFPQLGTVMLDLLHPTSAVCGMPLEPSLAFLRKHEGYDRGFYAGYLGPVNINNYTGLFVNLRCMQLAGGQGILYAGAGVTIDSVPEKEWAETEMKFNTLLNVIL